MDCLESILQFMNMNRETARELTRVLYGASTPKEEYFYSNALVWDAFQRGWASLEGIAQQLKEREEEECTEPAEGTTE